MQRGSRVGHDRALPGALRGPHKRMEAHLAPLTEQSGAFPPLRHPAAELPYMPEGEMFPGHGGAECRMHPGGALRLDGRVCAARRSWWCSRSASRPSPRTARWRPEDGSAVGGGILNRRGAARLVAITPARGAVSPAGALVVGAVAGTLMVGLLATPRAPGAAAGLFHGGGFRLLRVGRWRCWRSSRTASS
ncbi:hypothetical protein SUDANB6_00192 [Streptomyces sp. enrichment culture]